MGRYASDGIMTLCPTRDTLGLIAADLDDLAIADAVMSGEADDPLQPVEHLRLGVPRKYFWEGLARGMERACEDALRQLERSGVVLVEIDAAEIGEIDASASLAIAMWETRQVWREFVPRAIGMTLEAFLPTIASDDVRDLFKSMLGPEAVTDDVYRLAVGSVERMKAVYHKAFSADVDALITPTTIREAITDNESLLTTVNGLLTPTFPTFIRQTSPASLAGVPSISLPAGYLDNGLPFGLMLEAPWAADRQLLSITRSVHHILGKHKPNFAD
ncbi:hypothetical protein A2T82_31550 [Burkholderia cenocepacia]|nr:hypothetical protein A2T82_31550 [Burkholderia cenocepacia]